LEGNSLSANTRYILSALSPDSLYSAILSTTLIWMGTLLWSRNVF
jgi:hypothetical protein